MFFDDWLHMPFFHSGGINVLTIPRVHLGGTNIVCASFDVDRLFDQVETLGAPSFSLSLPCS
jgi:hypothetical protein